MSIQIKRGMKKDLPQLKDGELAFCRDTKELYVGNNGNENVNVTKKVEDRLDTVDLQLQHIGVNVKNFNAKGDGVTDDTTAIQSALDYCFENDLNLYFENGEYIISKPLIYYASSNQGKHSIEIKGETKLGVKIKKVGNIADDKLNINSVFIIANEDFKTNSNIDTANKFARNLTIKNIIITSDGNTDYGIYAPYTCASSEFRNINILNVKKAGIKFKQGVYLTDIDRVRIEYSEKGFDLSEGLNTSLNISNCYCTNISNVAYDLKGNYSNLYNCCADGCLGSVFKLAYFIGSMNGCGCESPKANRVVDVTEHCNVVINGLFAWNNYKNNDSTHIYVGGNSNVIFNSCSLMDRGNSSNTTYSSVYENGEQCYIEFNGCDFGVYKKLTNTTAKKYTTVKINGTKGDLNYRDNCMPYIGYDNLETNGIKSLGSAIFTGLSNNHYTYTNGDVLDYKSPTSIGDILLTKDICGTGAIGWINVLDRKEDTYFKGKITNINGHTVTLSDNKLDIEGVTNLVAKEWTPLRTTSGGSGSIRITNLENNTITVSNMTGTWSIGDKIYIPTGDNKSSQMFKIPVIINCRTTNRPTQSLQKGQFVFDEDLQLPIWWTGSKWINANGETV